MQREIKFRAWIDDYQKYIIPSHLQECEGGTIHYFTDSERMGYYDLDNPKNALEQFTGLHDKNETEIYEGDIIQYESNDLGVSIGIVEYTVCPYGSEFTKKWIKNGCGLKWNQYEVIGNIHENPELLIVE